MRVLHLGKFYAPQRGGIERCTQDLAEWQAAHGDAVGVLVHQAPGRWRGARERIAGVEVYRAGCLGEWVHAPVSPTFPHRLSRAIAEMRPDLLHLHLPNPSCFAALALPAARRLPWIVHWHADVSSATPSWQLRAAYRVYRPFEQAVLRRAAAIVATSQAYLDASAALARWRDKARVIPLGIGPAPAVTAAAPAWPDGDGVRLLAVGRFSRYKGFDVLIDALARLPQARLLLVGHGECAAMLRERADARGVADRVRFAGDLDDAGLLAAYAQADLFVLPSLDRGEAFGLVLLEAMRAGLATVASAIPGSGVGEVVADGVGGLLVPPGDVAALAATIARLSADAPLRQRLGASGRQRWQERFTLERSARRVRELYSACLDRACLAE